MTGEIGLLYSSQMLDYNFGPNHPLKSIRLKMTFELIKSLGILSHLDVSHHYPLRADEKQILLFHDPEYVDLVKKYSKVGAGTIDLGDTPAFKGCFEATALVVGASLQAAEMVVTKQATHAFNPSGGLHHAHRDRASGFCVFNDPAITIAFLREMYGLRRIVYLDIDVHHGDGVMYGYYSDPGVLDIDFHEDGRYIFPGTGFAYELGEQQGRGFKVNIPFPPYAGDEMYLNAFREIVPPLVRQYKPEVILMQCGADGHANDSLAHLNLTSTTYAEVASIIHQLAHQLCRGRLVLFGGGGYNVSNVARTWALILGVVAGAKLQNQLPREWRDLFRKEVGRDPPDTLLDEPVKPISVEKVRSEFERSLSTFKQRFERSSPLTLEEPQPSAAIR